MVARHVKGRLRSSWRKTRRFLFHTVLHADDPPGRLALGAAIGVFFAFTPTFGIQMLLVVFAAWLLRANKAVGLPVVWISNPATMMIIYYPCYIVGCTILGRESIDRRWWSELRKPPAGWWQAVEFYWSHLLEIAMPLWLGCLLVATCLAVPTYYLVYYVIRGYRLKRWGQLTPPA
ncbi:MAG: DUF2062 domain-containing protein [Planctomycetaceae bacterium]|nr:DUF2062 domain-containing protein [Planctomycetales bacterium]MCB9924807.1 DUF2062 domain-containing protein [Planctomycetaceae bacterium]